MKQVISISANGIMSGLQRKPGQGLDLTKFGPATVTRASEIVWDEAEQAWKIDVLQEAGKGVVTGKDFCMAVAGDSMFRAAIGAVQITCIAPTLRRDTEFAAPLLFGSYDDAVRVEIAYLDALRVKGHH